MLQMLNKSSGPASKNNEKGPNGVYHLGVAHAQEQGNKVLHASRIRWCARVA